MMFSVFKVISNKRLFQREPFKYTKMNPHKHLLPNAQIVKKKNTTGHRWCKN